MKTGKHAISILLLIAMIFTTIPASAFAQGTDAHDLTTQIYKDTKIVIPFTDINESDWFYDSVVFAYENRIFNGTSENSFSPGDGITRSMYVTALGRFAGIDQVRYSGAYTGFKDVAADAYYAPYVAWAVEKEITGGVGDSLFDTNSLVTREQMAVFSERFFKAYDIPYLTDADSEKIPLDLSDVSPWAREAVLNLYQAGILQGDQYGNFNPKATATRAESATIFMSIDSRLDCRGVASENGVTQPPAVINNGGTSSGNSGGGSDSDTEYIISFNIDGETNVDPIRVTKGQPCPSLPIPNKTNSLFVGWYTDASFTTKFEDNTVITGNLTLYAKYMDDAADYVEILSGYQIAEEKPVDPDFSIRLNASSTALRPADIQGIIQFVCTGGVDDRGISVKGGNGSFTLSMPDGFKPGADYTLTLLDDKLTFEGKGSTAKEYSFFIKKEESKNLVFNSGLVYIPAEEVNQIYCNGKLIESLSAAVFSISESGVDPADVKGYFTYGGSRALTEGEVICVYSGASPEDRSNGSIEDTMYDSIAYVKVTGIEGAIISYESANPEDVLFIAKTVAIKKDSSFTSTGGDQGFSFEVTSLEAGQTWSMGDSEPKAGNITVGDTIAVYDAHSLVQANEDDIILGTVTGISEGSSPYTITCVITTPEMLQQGMDYYQNTMIDIENLMKSGKLNTAMLQNEIQKQTLESGIVDKLAGQYAMLSLESDLLGDSAENTDGLRVLMSDGTHASAKQLHNLMAAKDDEKKVQVSDADVNVNIKSDGGHLGDGALVAEVKVSFDVTIKTEAGDSIKLDFSVTFIQEISLFVQASAGIDWGWSWGIPYPKECWVNASLSVKTYSGVQLKATLTTKSADSDKTIDISEKIKTIIAGNEEDDAIENVSGIYKHYQEFMKNDLDYIEIVKESLFEVNISLAWGLVQITVEPSFVVSAAANAAVTCTLSYQEGTKYSFTARMSSASLTFNKSTILDKQFDFSLYLVGKLGLRVGIELELKAGLISTKLNSMGIAAQAGLYIEWCGFFSYEYSRNYTNNTTTSIAQGAMYAELGVYLEIGANFQAGDGKWEKNFGLVSETFPLLSTNSKDYVYDFSYASDKGEKIIINKTKNSLPDYAFKMIQLDLSSGKSFLKDYDTNRFGIVFANKAFSIDDGRIVVDTDEDYLETNMSITWNSSPLAFTSVPIKRTFRVIYSDTENPVEKGLLTFKVNGIQIPELSRLADFDTNMQDAIPGKDEIMRAIGYSDYDRTVDGVGKVNLRYLGEGSYKSLISGVVNGSLELEYELPLREYTVTVKDVQNKDGSTTTKDIKAVYGESFDIGTLKDTCTEIPDKTYTKFFNVETRKSGVNGGQLISGGVGEALALQILSGSHTYHATYIDNSSTVTYKFLTLVGKIDSSTKILKCNTKPDFDYKKYVEEKNYLIYGNVDGDISTPVNGDRAVYITCVPANGYELTLVRNGGKYVNGYVPPEEYDSINGTKLPTGGNIYKENRAFAGWYEDSDFSGNPVAIAKENLGPKTYYAMWVAPEYTIRFDGAGGEGEMEEVEAVFGEATALTPSAFTADTFKKRADWETGPFRGWNTRADGSGISYDDMAVIVTPTGISASGVLTLYAQWDDFKVTYTPDNPNAAVPSGGMALFAAVKNSEAYPGTITMQETIDSLSRTINLPDGTTFSGNGHVMEFLSNPSSVRKILFIAPENTVKLENVEIRKRDNWEGLTQIENKGNLTIENSEIYSMKDSEAVICNREGGNLIIRNTRLRSNNETMLLHNAGTVILDNSTIGGFLGGNEAAYQQDGIVVNQGLMLLNNVNFSSNGDSTYNNGNLFNDEGKLYILNTSFYNNEGNKAGIVSDKGLLYIVNSLIGWNGASHSNNIQIMSEEGDAYLYNSVYGTIEDESSERLKIEDSSWFSDENIYNHMNLMVIKDPALRDRAVKVYLDYSNFNNIKIGFINSEGIFVSVLNDATESAPAVNKYSGGGERDLNDNRVGAEFLEITE